MASLSAEEPVPGSTTTSAAGDAPALVLIFLDVDGVLNCRDRRKKGADLHEDLVSRFVAMVREFDARVVLSTSWRLVPHLRNRLIDRLGEAGLALERILGDTASIRTPQYKNSRGVEIEAWLRDNNPTPPPAAWIAIDDLDLVSQNPTFFPGHHVHTSMDRGFDEKCTAEARRLLHKQGAGVSTSEGRAKGGLGSWTEEEEEGNGV
jgi:hypothetical protein